MRKIPSGNIFLKTCFHRAPGKMRKYFGNICAWEAKVHVGDNFNTAWNAFWKGLWTMDSSILLFSLVKLYKLRVIFYVTRCLYRATRANGNFTGSLQKVARYLNLSYFLIFSVFYYYYIWLLKNFFCYFPWCLCINCVWLKCNPELIQDHKANGKFIKTQQKSCVIYHSVC